MPWSNKALAKALHYSRISCDSRTAIRVDSMTGHECRHEFFLGLKMTR